MSPMHIKSGARKILQYERSVFIKDANTENIWLELDIERGLIVPIYVILDKLFQEPNVIWEQKNLQMRV